jgi:signal transduction histidine kinase
MKAMFKHGFFLFIFGKKVLKKYQILIIYFSFGLILSCNQEKVKSMNYKLFQNKDYQNNTNELKIKFLDSIFEHSKRMPNDTLYRNFLFNLSSEYYYLNEYSKSFEVSKKILLLSGIAKDTFSIARAYSYMGDTFEFTQKDSAYYFHQRAEKLYKAINNKERIGIELFKKAHILFFEGNYLESEIQVSNALLYLKNEKDAEMLFAAYSLMGLNFEKLEEFQQALKYQLLAKSVLKDIKGTNSDIEKQFLYSTTSTINLSNVYEKMFQYNKSIKELEIILNSDLKEKWTKGYVTALANLSYSKMMSGKLDGVERNFKDALYISRKNDFKDKTVYQLKNLGEYYSIVNDTVQAINYLKQSLQLSEKLKMGEEIKKSLLLLSQIDDQNAAIYDKRYIVISDSLAKAQRINRNKYARIEYETSVVEDENKILSAKNTYILIGSLLSIFALVLVIVYRYIKSQKREIEFRIAQQKAEEEIFDLLKEYQLKLSTAKEVEQNRISKELHDSVMNKLYGARMQLGILNDSDAKEIKEKRLTYVDLLQDIEQEIRTISHDLQTDIIGAQFCYVSLLSNLIQLQNEIGETFYSIEVDHQINWDKIDSLVKINIFRILQESILNVNKHAKASECNVKISLEKEKSILILNIQDNGKGFEQNDKPNGIGLSNIRERVKTIKAELEISSEVNIGTTICIKIKTENL